MLSCVTLIAIAVGLTEATFCTVKSECAANECCYIRPQYLIMSKRQMVLPGQPLWTPEPGLCETYRNPGGPCRLILNGHCGCSSGYSCQWVPEPSTTASAGRRSMIYHPGPGSYQCAADNP
ncbi:uncharacterized protein LOC127844316 [Dreissena polymorpha]|nr:uncharacterized protein LOC127844316 [Dreissena polymorpha]